MAAKKRATILGQDPEVLLAVWANVLSWLVSTFAPSLLPLLLPEACAQEEEGAAEAMAAADGGADGTDRTVCVSIGRPGGSEQLRLVRLRDGVATLGYNLPDLGPAPYTPSLSAGGGAQIPPGCVVLRCEAFSVNYADVCIRWGLYESAKKFVGYPIVPGFDVAGTVERVGPDVRHLRPGDRVFGCTLFGAYSTRVLVPALQLRPLPPGLEAAEAAAIPAVALTALHALGLAGHHPGVPNLGSNRSVLIHSAAGGVGSMLVQMAKILGLSPVVGVVGGAAKVDEALRLGCDAVIDKSSEDLWGAAERAGPAGGYSTILDANGVSTLRDSYDHLAPTGRLVVFGFHSNLPMGRAALSPLQWIGMGRRMSAMPSFDPMDMVTSNKSVLGFNLSFFADEKEVVSALFDQVCEWLKAGKLKLPRVVEMDMARIVEAHELIQSGKSVGKIVIRC